MNRERAMPKTVNAYIARFPPAVQASLRKIRTSVKRAAPGAKETVSYRIPSLKLNGPLIYFAGFKADICLYPMTGTLC